MVFRSLGMIEIVMFKFLACSLTLACEMTDGVIFGVTFQALVMWQCGGVGVSI